MVYGPNPLLAPWIKPSWLTKVYVQENPELGSPCWLWQGGCVPQGYGRLRVGSGRASPMVYLHRHSWEQYTGQKLGEFHGHHRCYKRNCFQPLHIEKLSAVENQAPTYFQTACPVSNDELVALYDLNAYFYKKLGYVINKPAMALG